MASTPSSDSRCDDSLFDEKLTAADLISFTWRVPLILANWPLKYCSIRLSGRPVASLHRRQRFIVSFMQSMRTLLSPRQIAILSRGLPTGLFISRHCVKNSLEHEVVTVPVPRGDFPPAVLHFVKPSPQAFPSKYAFSPSSSSSSSASSTTTDSERVVFYCHGGGYRHHLLDEVHMPFALDIATASDSSTVVLLEYSFTPDHQYPCQLVQAIAGLQYLMTERRIPARNIILAGDSAGAHLLLGLLAHIVLQAPFAPALTFDSDVDEKGAQFRATLLISPWVTLTGDEASMSINKRDDYLNQERLLEFVSFFQPDPQDVRCAPWQAPGAQAVWDQVFPPRRRHAGRATVTTTPLCGKVLVTIGTSEVLLDSCLDFGFRFVKCESVSIQKEEDTELVARREGDASAVMAVVSGEVHVQPGLDRFMSYKGGLTSRAISRFLESV